MNPYGIAAVDKESRARVESALEAMLETDRYPLPTRSSMLLALKNLKLMLANTSERELARLSREQTAAMKKKEKAAAKARGAHVTYGVTSPVTT